MAANDQPGTEREHRDAAAERQELQRVIDFEVDHLLESGNNQSHNNDVGEIVLQAFQAADREQIGVLLINTFMTGVQVSNHELIDAISKNQQSNTDHEVIHTSNHLSNRFGLQRRTADRVTQQTPERREHLDGTNRKATNASKQTQQHWHDADQPEPPDHALKTSLKECGWHEPDQGSSKTSEAPRQCHRSILGLVL